MPLTAKERLIAAMEAYNAGDERRIDHAKKATAWAERNRSFSESWPNITRKGTPPADADEWKDKPGKEELFSPEPGKP